MSAEFLTAYDLAPEDKQVFLHIPKTAGITLRTHLDTLWHGERCPLYFPRQLQGVMPRELAHYKVWVGHFNLAELEWLLPAPFVCITVLREPTARYLSDFLHLKYKPVHQATPEARLEIAQLSAMRLEEFITRDDLTITHRLPNLQARILGAPLRATSLPASRDEPYFGQLDAQALDPARAKQKLAALTGFGLTERFQESLYLFAFLFGWRPLRNVTTLNRGASPGGEEKPTPETRARLAELNRLDVELYQYAEMLFQERYTAMTDTLLERYGTRAHAGMRLPLADEVMHELLERHYEARYKPPAGLKTSRTYRFTFDGSTSGAVGWYARETFGDGSHFAWSGPEHFAALDLPRVGEKELEVRFRVLMALEPQSLTGLRLAANGATIQLSRTTDTGGASLFRGTIPRRAVERAPFVRLVWTVPRTMSPAQGNGTGGDERRLGIALAWVELEAKR